MDTDQNLLFGVLALQMDLIEPSQFVEACTVWTTRKETTLANLLVKRGWITEADRIDIRRLLERKLKKHGGDARAGLAQAPEEVKRSLAALEDVEIQRSLAGLPVGTATTPTATVVFAPQSRERYTLTRLHATGGIGQVWLARDGNLGRDVALKELRSEGSQHESLRSRFVREAQITGQLEHPGIVPIYELAWRSDDRQPFYTMRFLKGKTLTDAAREFHQHHRADSIGLLTLLNAFVVVCNTIAYAHSRNVIHRDLKGQNVILGNFGEVIVLDWGLAKRLDQPLTEAETLSVLLDSGGSGEVDLTAQGQAMGTPAYMAPEQAAGRVDLIDQRTDVYGLGAILYEILTGRAPFTGSDTQDVLRKVREQTPAPPERLWADVPSALAAACLRALAKEPAERYPSAAELGQVVQNWQELQRREAEQALRNSEALYHSLVETLPLSIFRKDVEGRLTFGNQRFAQALGRPLAEILGKTDFDLFPAELAEKYRRDDQAVMAGRVTVEVDEQHVTPTGQTLYVHVIKSPIYDSRGEIIGTQGIFWDVTERRRADMELAHERDLLHTLMDSVPLSIYFKDAQSRFTRINRTQAKYLGINRPEDAVGKSDFDFYPAAEACEYVADEQRIMKTGQPVLEKVEHQKRADDDEHWFLTTKVPIMVDSKCVGLIGVSRDFTQRKRAEEALAFERYLLHTLMDNLPDNIYFKDAASRFLRINKYMTRYFGLNDPQEAVGKTDFDFFTAEHAQPAFDDEQQIIRTAEPMVGKEEKETWLDGRLRWVSSTKMPFRDKDGDIVGTFGISRDITRLKQFEDELASERNLLRTLIDHFPGYIYIKDAESRFLISNIAHCRALGAASRDELVGKTDFDFFPREIAGQYLADEQKVVRSGLAIIDRVEEGVDRQGRPTRVLTSKCPVKDGSGRVVAIVGIGRDVTDRRL